MSRMMNLKSEDGESELKEISKAEKVYFIINPIAQNGGSMKIWTDVEMLLQQERMTYGVYFTEYKGHARKLAADILSGSRIPSLIIAVGGDGTVHEVINGAAGFPQAMVGSIPAGSGNDFVRGLQKSKNMKHALKLLLQPASMQVKAVDIGKAISGGKAFYFVNSLGIGVDAEITAEVNQSPWKKRFNSLKMGKLVYIYFFMKKILSYKRTDMQVEVDGVTHLFSKVWFIVVSNQPYFGGGIKILPEAKSDDGYLDVLAVHQLTPIQLMLMFITVFWGGHQTIKQVRSYKCRSVSIRSAQPVLIQADGEIEGNTEVSVSVIAHKMNIVTHQED
ncbi:diacylglycerol kinase family lipid kinase [Peribacillus saganii]|uniref:diacylglycerol kinase (ATP) n=1 Tax=Peribacillus saganii TaxID=2303992 RepID=A0A372LMV6_9BACI|nr:diacylglycerol kinase family protein [Peribacillus saganii]RFU68724.1 diacylglycerol kinase family lipid kinase [Peribacillus saganii]